VNNGLFGQHQVFVHLSQALDEVSPDQQQEINKKDCATEQLISDNLVKCVCGKNEVKMANSD
jgi:hypothetical protein